MPTYTTRNPRDGEKQGSPYYFVTRDEFLKMVQEEKFYEFEEVHGNLYGTPKKEIADIKANNKICLKDIDVKGAMVLKELLKDKLKVVTIFFVVEKQELKNRLIGRGEKDLAKRLERFDLELTYKDKYQHIINNVDLGETVKWCVGIIEKERQQ